MPSRSLTCFSSDTVALSAWRAILGGCRCWGCGTPPRRRRLAAHPTGSFCRATVVVAPQDTRLVEYSHIPRFGAWLGLHIATGEDARPRPSDAGPGGVPRVSVLGPWGSFPTVGGSSTPAGGPPGRPPDRARIFIGQKGLQKQRCQHEASSMSNFRPCFCRAETWGLGPRPYFRPIVRASPRQRMAGHRGPNVGSQWLQNQRCQHEDSSLGYFRPFFHRAGTLGVGSGPYFRPILRASP